MSKLLLGKPVADAMTQDLALRVDALKAAGVTPVLAIVRVGERPDDLSYERGVTKRAQSVGVDVRPFVLAEDAGQQQLEAVHGHIQNQRDNQADQDGREHAQQPAEGGAHPVQVHDDGVEDHAEGDQAPDAALGCSVGFFHLSLLSLNIFLLTH